MSRALLATLGALTGMLISGCIAAIIFYVDFFRPRRRFVPGRQRAPDWPNATGEEGDSRARPWPRDVPARTPDEHQAPDGDIGLGLIGLDHVTTSSPQTGVDDTDMSMPLLRWRSVSDDGSFTRQDALTRDGRRTRSDGALCLGALLGRNIDFMAEHIARRAHRVVTGDPEEGLIISQVDRRTLESFDRLGQSRPSAGATSD